MVTWSMNYTLSPFSSGSSSLRNSRLGYGIWQPAKTLEQKNTVELHQYMLAYNLIFIKKRIRDQIKFWTSLAEM